MLDFTINNAEYRVEKLDAKTQFHLSRKIAPLLPKLLPVFIKVSQSEKESLLSGNIGELCEVLEPFAEALANIPDEHASFIYDACLQNVMRKTGKDYAKIVSNNLAMFEDIDLDATLQIVIKVIWHNLGSFISGLLSKGLEEQ
jgi:hypothetical protein